MAEVSPPGLNWNQGESALWQRSAPDETTASILAEVQHTGIFGIHFAPNPSNLRWTLPLTTERGLVGIEYNRTTRSAKRDHNRDKDFRKKYGIDFAEYQRMLIAQKGACAICEQPETKLQNGSIRMLSVEHDHKTSAVRGSSVRDVQHHDRIRLR